MALSPGSSKALPETDSNHQPVRAPRGTAISCRGWPQEGALRMLMNSLEAEVAEHPQNLIANAGTGRAVRDWPCYHAAVRALQDLKNDETLLVQSGEPVGIFATHEAAPRVLLANSNLAGEASDGQTVPRLERLGLLMYGHVFAGSWLSIGAQDGLDTAYEAFAAVARLHFGDDLAGKWVVSGGMGGLGGAQALAATLHGAAFLGIDPDSDKIKRRIRAGYCDICVNHLDEAIRLLKNAVRKRQPAAVGLIGNCAVILPELARRGIVPDLLTDMTGAHDPLNAYVPSGLSMQAAAELRQKDPSEYLNRANASIARQVTAMLELQKLGALVFDFGNHLRQIARLQGGVENPDAIAGFTAEDLRPLFREGRGPVRWVALSGERADLRRADDLALELFPEDASLQRWLRLARDRVRFQGLPARGCWLGYEQRILFGRRLNDLVAQGQLKAPVVLARAQLDGGSGASPPERMRDGSGAICDWALLDALVSTASGASWVSVQGEEGAGVGSSVHAAQAIVADGATDTARRIERVMANDCRLGIARPADAGDAEAVGPARPAARKIPLQDT